VEEESFSSLLCPSIDLHPPSIGHVLLSLVVPFLPRPQGFVVADAGLGLHQNYIGTYTQRG